MSEKTKTVVVIERHEQTITRRSRRTISGQVMEDGAVARPLGAPFDETEPVVKGNRRSLPACLKTVAIKSVSWLRRMMTANDRKKKLSSGGARCL